MMVLTPEHIHAMLNHLPVIGFGLLIVVLAYSVIRNEPHTFGLGLSLAAGLAIITSVVIWTGEQAHERFMFESVSQFIDDTAPAWIEEHEHRAEIASIAAYITGGLAVIGLIAGRMKPAWRRAIGGGVLVMVMATTGLMSYTAQAGGRIHHPEFRTAPDAAPPGGASHEHEHDHKHTDGDAGAVEQ